MPHIQKNDFLVFNRAGVDYKAEVEELGIPEKTSELTNDSGFITTGEIPPAFSGDYNDLTNTPTIPTDNAELANGANYITLAEVPDPVLDGSLVFKGTVADQLALPGDPVVGEFYKVTADDTYFAWGVDNQWHDVGRASDVNLDGYATEAWVEAKNYITLAEVPAGFSGDYNDLTNQPTIPTDNAELANGANYITLSEVPAGFSGDYNDLTNTPDIPSKTSELDNDSGFITLSDVPAAPDGGIPEAPKDGNQYARKDGAWAEVEIPEGFSGDYNDLTNQPTIPTDNADLANGANYITLAEVPDGFSGDYNDLTNQPTIPTDNAELANGANYITLSEVPEGFSGDYNDLTNQPTIPTDNADLANGANYITLAEVPDPVIDGALIFKGTVADQLALPGDPAVGHFYKVTADDSYFAWGEDNQWHNVGDASDVDLDEYARLDGAEFSGSVVVGPETGVPTAGPNTAFRANVVSDEKEGFRGSSTISVAPMFVTRLSPSNQVTSVVRADGEAWFNNTEIKGTLKAVEFIGDGSKLTNLPTGPDINLDEYARLDGATFTGRVLAGQDFRNGDPSYVGVEIDGEKGIVHVKGKNNTVTPFEVFQSGSNVNNVSASVFRVTNNGGVHIGHDEIQLLPDGHIEAKGDVKAASFEGDGVQSKTLEVSASGVDLASDDGQGFQISDAGTNTLQFGSNRAAGYTAFQIYKGTNKRLDISATGVITLGQRLHDNGTKDERIKLDGNGAITAKEFIGDGSKLTGVGLPDFRTLTPLS